MNNDKIDMFRNRLIKVYRHLSKQARRMGITNYRVYDHDLPEFPYRIEFYGDKLYVSEYKRRHGLSEEAHHEWHKRSQEVMSEVFNVSNEEIFSKLRKRKEGRLDQYRKVDEEKEEFITEEAGLKFILNLTDYLDTGLFLDHRITRQMVKDGAAGKRVLNLFCYTGSFSVYAAAGGADEVVSVDLSNTYLDWAERNMKLNGFVDETKYKFIRADIKQYLGTVEGSSFDIIVMDPPTFSNSKMMKDILDIQRDHPKLINQCLEALSTGGVLYFSTNFKKFEIGSSNINSENITDITKATTPFDFEGKLNRKCYLIKKSSR